VLRKFSKKKRDAGDLVAIIDNLNHVLNTRKSFGSWLKPFGIGDWNEYKSRGKIVDTIIEEIKENIRLYEPRVVLEDIAEVPSDSAFRMRFQVKCIINDGEKPIYIVLDSLYNRVYVEDQ
jgi:predicted component of type VI protein secretion system